MECDLPQCYDAKLVGGVAGQGVASAESRARCLAPFSAALGMFSWCFSIFSPTCQQHRSLLPCPAITDLGPSTTGRLSITEKPTLPQNAPQKPEVRCGVRRMVTAAALHSDLPARHHVRDLLLAAVVGGPVLYSGSLQTPPWCQP